MCTFYEAATGRILFFGDSVADQLIKIYRVLGSPNEDTWPDDIELRQADVLETLPPMHRNMKVFENKRLHSIYKSLITQGLVVDPNMRPPSLELQDRLLEGLNYSN